MSFKIILSSFGKEELQKAWSHDFEFCDNVEIVDQNILDIESDAIVSPGNSFGFMDGGLDLAISQRFGWEIQSELKQQIEQLPMRELLVGQAITIQSKLSNKYVICTPTMRVPSSKNIATSINAYLSMKAALIAGLQHQSIQSIAISGLCTGTGGMLASIASKQMYSAYEEVMKGILREFPTYMDALKFQRSIDTDHP